MNELCLRIEDLMIPYLQNRLNEQEKGHFIMHIAECKECRDNLAYFLRLHKELNKEFKEVPKSIKVLAYDKIRRQKQNDLNDLLNYPKVTFKIFNYVIDNVKQGIKLPFKKIKEAEKWMISQ